MRGTNSSSGPSGTRTSGVRRNVGRLTRLAVVLLVVGAALVTTAALAAAATPTITFTQSTPLAPGGSVIVTVKASGMTPKSIGGLFECNSATPQPTIDVVVPSGATNADVGQIPVGCSLADTVVTTSAGKFPSGTAYGLVTGVLGPPAQGVDSSGNQAADDADNFPCPPTSGSAGCELLYVDAAGDTASAPITFSAQTTTTTGAGATTTTTAACNAKAASITATNATTGTQATVTVTPATCLVAGQTVTVTGQGLQPTIGSILECNAYGSSGSYGGTGGATLSSIVSGTLEMTAVLGTVDKSGSIYIDTSGGYATVAYTSVTTSGTTATFSGLSLTNGQGSWTVAANAAMSEGQPAATYLSNAIPVSCTPVKTFEVSADGTIAPQFQSFTVVEGTTGPPCGGSSSTAVACQYPDDSSGGNPATDAAAYPCPPTSAQTAAGIGCVIAVGDLGGDKAAVPISFNIGAPPITTTTTSPSSSSQLTGSGSSSSGSSSSSSGSLAFTGSGPGIAIMGVLGVLFVLAGGTFLLLVDAPRRLLLAAARRLPRPAQKKPRS